MRKQSTDERYLLRGSNPLASLWKVCSLRFAAMATAESGMNNPNRRNSSAGIFRQLFSFLIVSFATI